MDGYSTILTSKLGGGWEDTRKEVIPRDLIFKGELGAFQKL